jgi:hypothetical protein
MVDPRAGFISKVVAEQGRMILDLCYESLYTAVNFSQVIYSSHIAYVDAFVGDNGL